MPEFDGDYGLIIGEDNQIQIDSKHKLLPVCHVGKAFYQGTLLIFDPQGHWGPLPSFEEKDWPYGNTPDYLPDRAWAYFPQLNESVACSDIKAIAIRPNTTYYSAFKPKRGLYHPRVSDLTWDAPYEGAGYLDTCIVSEGPYHVTQWPDPLQSPASVEYIAYSYEPLQNPPKGYGLEIYNDDGDVVFNSGVNTLKIREVKLVDISNSYYYIYGGSEWRTIGFNPITVTHDTPNPFYLMPIAGELLRGCQKVWSSSYWVRTQFTLGIKKLSSTSFSLSWIRVWYGDPRTSMYNNYAMHPSHVSIAICTL